MKTWLKGREGAIRGCMVLMLLFGIILSFMIPPWQTPDEYSHVLLIGAGEGNLDLADTLRTDMNLEDERIRYQYEEKINLEQWRDAMTKAPGYHWTECMPKGVHLSLLKHWPATFGILLGVLFRLPTFWVLELGELFSLIFYLTVCWFALKLMPVKKEILLMFMVFPMTMQQASSLSYDAVLIPLCFLFVAYIFHMRYTKERLGWRDVALTLGLLLFITYIKLPYVFLGLLVFLLPKDKISLKIGSFEIDGQVIQRFRIPAALGLLVVAAVGFYIVRDNYWVRLVTGMLLEWKRSAYLFTATARTFWRFLITSSVGQFGWLEVPLPFTFAFFSYGMILVLAVWGKPEESAYCLKGRGKLFVWGVFLLLSALTVVSMVNHIVTIMLFGAETTQVSYDIREALYQIPYIGGLQGRYFIPFLVLPFLGLPQKGKERDWKIWLVVGYLVVAMILTIRVLYLRYWV